MTEIEKTIEDIQKQFKGIGIDYTNGKDMTAVCILGDKAEIVIEALREYAEQQDPKPLTLDELRQMDGEPVYVVTLDNPLENQPYLGELLKLIKKAVARQKEEVEAKNQAERDELLARLKELEATP